MERSLGERIRTLREAAGLTQNGLAEKTGVSRASISYYENNNRTPDAFAIRKIAGALGLSCDYLLRGEDPATVDAHDALGLSVTALVRLKALAASKDAHDREELAAINAMIERQDGAVVDLTAVYALLESLKNIDDFLRKRKA